MTYTITYTSGRIIDDLQADSPEDALYFAEEIAFPSEDIESVNLNQ